MSDTSDFEVVPLRAFKDNYIWTLRNDCYAAVVDPGDAQPVLDYLRQERLQLCAVLATHHHADHVGGVAALLARQSVPVYGPRGEPIPTLTHPVGEGDLVHVPQLGLRFSVLDIPGHTRAHPGTYCVLWRKFPVLRRYAVCLRLRATVRRHGAANGSFARQAGGPA
jgi:hydroxyacylglutathione hydrolase